MNERDRECRERNVKYLCKERQIQRLTVMQPDGKRDRLRDSMRDKPTDNQKDRVVWLRTND